MKILSKIRESRWLQIVVGVMVLVAAYWMLRPIEDDWISPFDPNEIAIPDIYDAYYASKVVAADWHEDAYLTDLSVNIKPYSYFLAYSFSSRENPNLWLNVYPELKSGGYQFETSSGELPEGRILVPVELERIPTTPEDVYLTAYSVAIEDFERLGMQPSGVLISLDQIYGLRWNVSLFQDTKTIRVEIDPDSGEIIEVFKSEPFEE